MLLKGTRTFDSMMNAVARHLGTEGDWEADDEGEIVFGTGEWSARMSGEGSETGVELFNESYSDTEMTFVERAIGLLEGLAWSAETAESRLPERKVKKRAPLRRVHDDGRRSDSEE